MNRSSLISKALSALVSLALGLCICVPVSAWGASTITPSTARVFRDIDPSIFAGGTGTQTDPYQIATAAQLAAFATSVNANNTYAGTYISLTKSIALTGNWTPIGKGVLSGTGLAANSCQFMGNFDGKNNTITGLSITSVSPTSTDTTAIGLFGVLGNGGSIQNLTLTNVGIDVPNFNSAAGGLVGIMLPTATVNNVTVGESVSNASSVKGNTHVGGIVGCVLSSGTISNCTNYANVTGTGTGSQMLGGIVGAAQFTLPASPYTPISITGCKNSGIITGDYQLGGIVGFSSANISNCTNSGAVTSKGTASTPMSTYNVGGIVGTQAMYGSVSGCSNTAPVTNFAAGMGTGGIVGHVSYDFTPEAYPNVSVASVTNNQNSGAVAGSVQAGGIVGAVDKVATITGNTNTAPTIAGASYAAGVVGAVVAPAQALPTALGTMPTLTIKTNSSSTPASGLTTTSSTGKTNATFNNTLTAAEQATINMQVDQVSTGGEAAINGVSYPTLAAAWAAAKEGDTVTLLSNINNASALPAKSTGLTTLDLGGFNIAFAPGANINVKGGLLAIKGSGTISPGTSASNSTALPTLAITGTTSDVATYSIVTIEKGVTIEGSPAVAILPATADESAVSNGVVLSVNGVLKGVGTEPNSQALVVDSHINASAGNIPQIALSQATLSAASGVAVALDGISNTKIADSTITATGTNGVAVQACAGTLNVTNSTLTGGSGTYKYTPPTSATPTDPNPNASPRLLAKTAGIPTVANVALALTPASASNALTATVNGGTYTATKAFVQTAPVDSSSSSNVMVAILGGTFNGGLSATQRSFISGGTFTDNPATYLENNYTVQKLTDGKYQVIPTGQNPNQNGGGTNGTGTTQTGDPLVARIMFLLLSFGCATSILIAYRKSRV